MKRLYQFAEAYIRSGLCPIPVWPGRRKNPRLTSITEYRERLPESSEWRRWAQAWPNSNLALITGYHGNLCCLDFDSISDYNVWFMGVNPRWRDTWTVETGRGKHVYFVAQGDPGQDRMYTRDGREVLLRAKGAYVIAPPSIHYTGKPYRTVRLMRPVETRVDWILAGWREKAKAKNGARPTIATTPPTGSRPPITDYVAIASKRPNARGAYQAYCPFHDDSTPSAWVNPAQGRFGCNACWPGKWWDVINVIAMLEGVGNDEVMKRLRIEK